MSADDEMHVSQAVPLAMARRYWISSQWKPETMVAQDERQPEYSMFFV